uniref:Peptidase A1 domain-containing protein n=1 Tax=Triticum aestivum TaxID=4565 RepID=A0A3B6U9E6_WHEAT
MASIPKLVILLLCTCLHTLLAHGGDDLRTYKVLHAGALKSATVNCSQPQVTPSYGGVTVPLHHRHGPCSPSPVPSTKAPTLQEMLRRDQLRAAYITRMYSGVKGGAGDVEQSDITVPTTLGTSLGTLEYLITVGIGSPAVTQTMLIDTGSDVSWVQCKPCSQCHAQADSLFNPSSSSTYSAFPCSSAREAAPTPNASILSNTAMVRPGLGLTAPTRSRWAPAPSRTSSSGAASLSRATFSKTRPMGSWGSAAAQSLSPPRQRGPSARPSRTASRRLRTRPDSSLSVQQPRVS